MKAMVINAQGGPEVFEWRDMPDPVPAPGQVLVDIHAASVNGADWKVRRGVGPFAGTLAFPYILGRDFSGVVKALGDGVSSVAVGDPVFAVLEHGVEGTYAERIAVDEKLVCPKPESLSHSQAAAIALTGLTALAALIDATRLGEDDVVLIHGGAGGVGSIAIQYARHVGATVATTCRAANAAYVRELGADIAIDYSSTDFAAAAPQCDVVLDTIGGEVQARSLAVLKEGGKLLFTAPGPADIPEKRPDIVWRRPDVVRGREFLERLAGFVASGAIRPPQIEELAIDRVSEAHARSEDGHVRGKIVLTLDR